AINELVVEGLARGALADHVHVLYVSPLKALSNDIQKNLQQPLMGIRDKLLEHGLPDVPIRDAVRTGDTSMVERERMRRIPPHILVTTPESLFILLTSASGRAMLKHVRHVIVDELHAVAGSKRGSHLMLSLERLSALTETPPVRIGLSATVKPIEEMAKFLVPDQPVAIIDSGHVRKRDIALEIPRAPLDGVMANEVWGEMYDRIAELISQHRTTLIFVNQRRIAERAARHLAERIGEEHVTAHHGSLSKEHRLKAEQRLKAGTLKALVATSSLELGIDIGEIDLVCQLGSPRSIAAFLQRVGRAGHAVDAVPKGRLFPLSLDDLLECTALLDGVRRGELDRIHPPSAPLDVLAQQIVAEVASREWGLDELYAMLRQAQPYRELPRQDFDAVVKMLAEGYTTRRGRRAAHLHLDAVNGRLRGRRGAKLTAVTHAGVIPDQFDYDVVMMPEEQRIGTLNEDFAFESIPGDIFQLGNASYRVLKIETGKVIVQAAPGQPPTMPFWFGEAPGRTTELSAAVSRLMETADEVLLGPASAEAGGEQACAAWLVKDIGIPQAAAMQLAQYLAAARAALGTLPTLDRIILERFFDEVGDTHLVIHSPYGSRINKAWGLALRKRFCRQFNFELQASALEDSIVLSLGPTHSFPLGDIKNYLKSATAREVLIQALLDAPMFNARWRWNATTALAIRRMHAGKKLPPQFQRSDAEDLLCVVFPDQVACAENLTGEREIPDHPLVKQTIDDCLHVTMDVDGLLALLGRIERGEVMVEARDLTGPSPLSGSILSARPYAFLDDGDAENRRTRAVNPARLLDAQLAGELAQADPAAVQRVREEAWPDVTNADELHDALCMHAFLTQEELAARGWQRFLPDLEVQKRVALLSPLPPRGGGAGGEGAVGARAALWVAAERIHEFQALFPELAHQAGIRALTALPPPDLALKEILRNRLELLGPVTAEELGAPLGLADSHTQAGLLQLEAEGAVMRGHFLSPSPHASGERAGVRGGRNGDPLSSSQEPPHPNPLPHVRGGEGEVWEWCERRLLARIHRYTREKSRAGFQPVAPAQFMRFLFRWHGLSGGEDERREGDKAMLATVRQLEGYPAPAGAWEHDLLPARLKLYTSDMLDRACASGAVAWWRAPSASGGRKSGPVRATPVLLCERESLSFWQEVAGPGDTADLSGKAHKVLELLQGYGALFIGDLVAESGLLRAEAEDALGELVSHGLVTADSFAGLRSLVAPSDRRARTGLAETGRWALARMPRRAAEPAAALAEPAVEHIARVLLRRYGVVFRKLLEREDGLPPWRELFYVYRRLEARGEVRGGRFVSGFAGEQFALADAAALLRKVPEPGETPERVSISAADPLNLAGIVTPGDKLPAIAGNRVLFDNGVPIAVQVGGRVTYLKSVDAAAQTEIRDQLVRRARQRSNVPRFMRR
ncbi:MAG TPA: DEAD/DEAH box helicase, partial [Solimonas sp.]|nr:DEAD/DEAH box helicase [Solimonas sp.]